MTDRCIGLDAWIERLTQAELPALAAVVQDLHRLSEPDKASVQQLAEVLLRDASLTSKVLRIANSVYYNPSQESIRTMSRAIVLIGFDNVRLIGMSACLIDSLLAKAPREQLLTLLARSFHAAVQARNLAGYVLSKHQEEVFIAALLHTVGELAFWAAGGEQADELAVALSQPGVEADEVTRQQLGMTFRQLTLGLVKRWNLGELAAFAHGSGNQHDPAVRAVSLGVRISEAALEGWESPQMNKLVRQIAQLTGVDTEEAMRQVLASAEEAVDVATTFGAPQLGRLIPNTDPEQIRLQQVERQARLLQPDLQVLQQALQDLGMMVSGKADVGLVLDTLLHGLHRGVGLERAMLTVLADGQTSLRAKKVVGAGSEQWLQSFQLPAQQPEQPHIFAYSLRNREAIWMGVPASYNLNELVTLPLRQQIGQGMFFVAPLMAGSREIGLLYGDCRVSGRALKHEQFVAFQRFAQLAGRCLEAIGGRR